MDMEPQGPQDGSDGAERAFEALRGEVATQGRLLQRVASTLEAQAQRPATLMPDYSPTLGAIAKSLQAVQARLQAIEEKPALMATAQDYRRRLEEAGQAAGKIASDEVWRAARVQKAAAEELEGHFRAIRSRKRQNWYVGAAAAVGIALGFATWAPITQIMPMERRYQLAVSLIGGDELHAGATLMQKANPAGWDRLFGLLKACGNQTTELCEAAMAARTSPPEPAPPPDKMVKPASPHRARRLTPYSAARKAPPSSQPSGACDQSGQNPDDCDPGCGDCAADSAEPAQ